MFANWEGMAYSPKFKPRALDDLIRLGRENDGGYVLPKRVVDASEGLLSFGVSDDWEFEKAFLRQKRVNLVAFDHTVTGRFWAKWLLGNLVRGTLTLKPEKLRRCYRLIDYKRFFDGKSRRHVRKAIGYSASGAIDLSGALRESRLDEPIFLKMDIEGWEYRVLDELASRAKRFSGMAIEFHDTDLHRQRIEDFIEAVAADQALVHFHPNNFGARDNRGDSIVVEMTFANTSLISQSELRAQPLPIAGLDAPNNPHSPEGPIEFATL
jgi:hypothetical protein